jgi:hypothetical protein
MLLPVARQILRKAVRFLVSPLFRARANYTGSMNTGRWSHTATLLADGKVLVVGGTTLYGGVLASAELYDPATGTWTVTGSLNH